jgi:hypothetical protein
MKDNLKKVLWLLVFICGFPIPLFNFVEHISDYIQMNNEVKEFEETVKTKIHLFLYLTDQIAMKVKLPEFLLLAVDRDEWSVSRSSLT